MRTALPLSEFLNALFASTDSDITLDVDGQPTTGGDKEFLEQYSGQLRVSPVTPAGSCFVFGAQEDAPLDAHRDCMVAPTASLRRGDTTIFIWAFDKPVNDTGLNILTDALGMTELGELLPLPGTDGWTLEHLDESTVVTYDAMVAAYLGTYGDATIRAPYSETDYSQEITVTLGAKTDSKQWKPMTLPLGTFLAKLCRHIEGPKDGPAFVLADMVPGQRLKNSVKTLFAVGLDVDTGEPSEEIDAALTKFGHLAVRYSTHSHNKTKTEFKKDKVVKFTKDRPLDDDVIREFLTEVERWHPSIVETAFYAGVDHNERGIVVQVNHAPMPKHRIVVPFLEPFEIAKEAALQKDAMAKWAKVPKALADLLNVPLDTSCTDPSRLFYFPRHAQGRSFEVSIWGGSLFDWRTLTLDNPLDKLAAEVGKSSGKSATPEGKELGRWSLKRGHGFQIADVIEEHCPERIRGNATRGFDIECPFDEDHSNAGDTNDKACFAVNAGDGASEFFTVSCRHETCRDKTMLDMLGKMLRDGWFDKDVLKDERYNATVAEDAPQPEVADEGNAGPETSHNTIQDAIVTLTPSSPLHDVLAVVQLIADTDLPKGEATILLSDVTKATGGKDSTYKTQALKDLLKDARAKRIRKTGSALDAKTTKLMSDLSKSLGREFTLPPRHVGKFSLDRIEGKVWICCEKPDEDFPVPVSTPFVIDGGITYEDRGGERALRVRLLNQDDVWVSVDIKARELATASGNEAIGELMALGLAPSKKGRDILHDVLLRSQLRGPKVYDTPGYRDGAFICPSGEVLLAKGPVELSDDKRLKSTSRAGSLAGWREGVRGLFEIQNCFHFHAGVLMGFAGALASLAGDDMLSFDLGGSSTGGKTTTQAIASGSWGAPGPKDGGLFITSHGTANAHETRFEIGSGTVTALDDFGKLDAGEQQDIYFMAHGGNGKRRADREGNARATRKWFGGCLITSSETELSERLRLGKVRQAGGLAVRAFTIRFTEAGKISDADMTHVATALKNFGQSGPAFVRAAADAGYIGRDKIKPAIDKLIDDLENTKGAGNEYRRRAARQVGYLWLAGEIAAKAGLIPTDFALEDLAKRLWNDFLQSDNGPTDPAKRATDHLIDWMRGRWDVEIISLIETEKKEKARQYREAFGYYDEDRIILRTSKFSEMTGGFVGDRVLRRHLLNQAILVKENKDSDILTWRYYPGLGKGQFVVLDRAKIESDEDQLPPSDQPEIETEAEFSVSQ